MLLGGSDDNPRRVALDADSLCERLVVECGDTEVTLDECQTTFALLRVTDDCASALENASCEELEGNDATASATLGSSLSATCFPACSGADTQSCNGDGTISLCTKSLATYVIDCNDVCANVSKRWSGVCGSTYEGQTAEKDKCWCK